MHWFDPLTIILASQSPRRAELMKLAGFKFMIRSIEVDESYPPDLSAGEVAAFLAVKKANAQKHLIKDKNEVIIAADSVVILDDKIMGKPVDKEEAFQMIRSLSGKSHIVTTGVCLYSLEKKEVFSVSSGVFMNEISEDEINYYIEKYQPYDKAGSYGIQEWIGLTNIISIEGSYTNIMGLPMEAVYRKLGNFL